MDSVIDRFLDGLRRAGRDPAAPLGLAYSGGIDSTGLLVLALRGLPGARLVALHVDHAVRADSAEHAAHCRRLATSLGVDFDATRLDPDEVADRVSRHGLEGGLRALRFAALEALCERHGVSQLALAHQADDAVEGHLLALIRGSGLVGQGGLRWSTRRGGLRLLRPLLEVARSELEALVGAELGEAGWVDDPTNRDLRFARNRLRHEIVPRLRDLAGGGRPLRRAVGNLRDDREGLEALLDGALDALGVDAESQRLDLRPALDREGGVPERVLVAALRRFVAARSGGYPPSRGHVERLLAYLAERGRTRWLDLPGLRLRVADGVVRVDDASIEPSGAGSLARSVPLRVGATTRHEELGVAVEVGLGRDAPQAAADDAELVVFDARALGNPAGLCLRGVRRGDRFRPFGLDGSVRLRRWLAGRGVARQDRARVPVVALGERVLWVIGHRRSQLAPVTDSTQERLVLRRV